MTKIVADFLADTIKAGKRLILLPFNGLSKGDGADFVGELRLSNENVVSFGAHAKQRSFTRKMVSGNLAISAQQQANFKPKTTWYYG